MGLNALLLWFLKFHIIWELFFLIISERETIVSKERIPERGFNRRLVCCKLNRSPLQSKLIVFVSPNCGVDPEERYQCIWARTGALYAAIALTEVKHHPVFAFLSAPIPTALSQEAQKITRQYHSKWKQLPKVTQLFNRMRLMHLTHLVQFTRHTLLPKLDFENGNHSIA